QQMLLGYSKKLRSNPALTRGLYAACVIGILVEPFIHVRMFPSYSLYLWIGMFGITIFHELGMPWLAKFDDVWKSRVELLTRTNAMDTATDNFDKITPLIRSLTSNRFMMNVIGLFAAVFASTYAER